MLWSPKPGETFIDNCTRTPPPNDFHNVECMMQIIKHDHDLPAPSKGSPGWKPQPTTKGPPDRTRLEGPGRFATGLAPHDQTWKGFTPTVQTSSSAPVCGARLRYAALLPLGSQAQLGIHGLSPNLGDQ